LPGAIADCACDCRFSIADCRLRDAIADFQLPITDCAVRLQLNRQLAIDTRQFLDASVANDVVFHVVLDHVGQLKLPQNFGRPNAVRSALTDSRVVYAHEFRARRHDDLAADE
jgi:hypothetical protein